MFKVVPDQLRVSDGWVRCGQCDEVFDANAYLQSLEITQTPTPVKQTDPNPYSWGDSLDADGGRQQPEIQLDFPEETSAAPALENAKDLANESEIQDAYVEPHLDGDMLEDLADASDPLDAVPAEDLGASIPDMDETMLLPHSALHADATSTPAPHFLKPERTASAQQSRGARLVVGFLCGLSACFLLGQWVVHERDRIAATEPAALALLEPLCGVLDCSIAPLRQIESVVIDSSSFGKTQADVYRLGFAIKSTALVDVALPSLELTLTDAQDKAVVRRVFSSRDLGAQRATLSPSGEWASSVPVAVKLPAGAERIAGYRLLAFYP